MKIKKGDNVLITSGKDKGKTGKVRFAYPKDENILVEGLNLQKKHSKAQGAVKQAGIIEREAPLNVSNVMLICKHCNKPARIGLRVLEDGRRVRICRVCREVID
jgi:large subunit ribosomal protein L24